MNKKHAMNAADRAVSILRGGLKKPAPSIRRIADEIHEHSPASYAKICAIHATADNARKGFSPFEHPNKSEYERFLNDQPFPANPAPSLIFDYKGKRPISKKYGQWLYRHNYPVFLAGFDKWRKTQ